MHVGCVNAIDERWWGVTTFNVGTVFYLNHSQGPHDVNSSVRTEGRELSLRNVFRFPLQLFFLGAVFFLLFFSHLALASSASLSDVYYYVSRS